MNTLQLPFSFMMPLFTEVSGIIYEQNNQNVEYIV